jgi:hypothetical protein
MPNLLGYLNFKGYVEYRIALTALAIILCCLPMGRGLARRAGRIARALGPSRGQGVPRVLQV